jgi:hypothetical protein
VPPGCEIAGATGHVSGEKLIELGSCDRKRTATCPLGKPVAGTAGQAATFGVPSGMRPNFVTSYVDPSRSTLIVAALGQSFATNAAKQGGAKPKNEGVATTKSHPKLPWLSLGASHAATH